MKQEASKKSKLWIWLAVGIVAVVAVVGLVLALVLGGGQGQQNGPAGPVGGRPDIYWNIDRVTYMENSLTGLSTREPESDGNFYITFAYNGEQVKLKIADKRLVNFIDTMDIMGLVKDADGVVIDAVDVTTVATEVGKNIYVQKVDGNTIVANSSIGMNGMQVKIAVTDLTQVYDITGEGKFVGEKIDPATLKPLDAITIYANDKEENTHVYLMSHPQTSKLYWRADQKYDSAAKSTSRVPDENGVYTVPFFCEGERVELKCKDKSIVTSIDYRSRWCPDFAFIFDEEGYIVDKFDSAVGVGGMWGCRRLYVTSIEGETITAENIGNFDGSASSYTFTIPEGCFIYDASLAAKGEGRQGKPVDSLQVNDLISVWADPEGKPMIIYIGLRTVDSPIYYNVNRMYAGSSTTRKPNAQGWYEVDVVVEGQYKTLKCKDKAVVSYLDSYSYKFFTAKVNGDIIEKAYIYECAYANSYLCNGYYVTTVSGMIFSAESASGKSTVNGIMHPECKVYDLSGVSGKLGAETKLQLGDKIFAAKNAAGEVMRVFVIGRSKTAYCPHCKQNVEWKSYNGGTLGVGDAHFFMPTDITQGSQVVVGNASGPYEVVFDLNGKTLTRNDGAGRAMVVYEGATLYLFDSKGGGAIRGSGKVDLSGATVLVNNATLNFHSGTLTYVESGQNNPRGPVLFGSGGDTVINMYGGTVTGGVTKPTEKYPNTLGGNVYMYGGVFNLYGGTISNGSADRGGNVYLTSPEGKDVTFNMTGGEVTGGMATDCAGNIYAGKRAIVNLSGGVVSNGTAGRQGGNIGIFEETAKVTISGTEVVNGLVDGSKDEKSGYGGNIYQYMGHLTISGGKVSGGEVNPKLTTSYCGNIYVYGDAKKVDGKVVGKYETSLTITGGEISEGVSGAYNNVMVRSGEYCDLTMTGGYIDGAFYVNGPKSFLLGGDLKTGIVKGGLTIKAGVLATLAEIKDGADINVSATGVFTTETKNAESYLKYVKSASGSKEVVVENNALAAVDAVFSPEKGNKINEKAQAMTFTGGKDKLVCPYDGKEYTWVPLTNESVLNLGNAKHEGHTHFYLAEDLNSQLVADTAADFCLHLNGHKITHTSSNKSAILAGKSSGVAMMLNIMGSGEVMGRGMGTTSGGVDWKAGGALQVWGTTVNLFGGTYMCHAERGQPVISTFVAANSVVNMYEGATISGANKTASNDVTSCVYILGAKHSFNMYGGLITGGQATKGGNLQLLAGNAYIEGGIIEGDVYVAEGANLTLAKNADINETNGGLDLTSGAVVTLKDLTADANINVTVNKNTDFTNALSDEQAAIALTVVKGEGIEVLQNETTKALYAVSASGDDEGDDDQLTELEQLNQVYTDAVAMQSLDEVVGVFDAATAAGQTTVEAVCPKCGETVTWAAITAESADNLANASYNGATHFFLAENIEHQIVGNTVGEFCLHLNAKEISYTAGNKAAILAGKSSGVDMTLNVMGDGLVIGKGFGYASGTTNWKAGGAIQVWGTTVNLFGGVYQCNADRDMPVISTFVADDSIINMYEGTVIDGSNKNVVGDFTSCVLILGAKHSFNMYGGNILYGQATNGGAINATKGTVNLAGGVIMGGTATNKGANVYMTGGTLNLAGTVFDGGVYVGESVTTNVSGVVCIGNINGGLDLTSGAKLTLGEIEAESEIFVTVDENVAFTVANDKAADYKGYFKAMDPTLFVTVKDNALQFVDVYAEATAMQSTDSTTGVFDAATAAGQTTVEAVCPKCGETVTWQAIGQDTENMVLSSYGNVTHFFLAEDISWETKNYRLSTAANGNAEVCLHLNNKNFTQPGTANVRALHTVANTTMNVMGDGVITGRAYLYNDTTYMGVVDAEGTVNIFGGTYKDTKGLAILATRGSKNPAINMYAGTVESTLGTTSDAKSSVVRVNGATHSFNLYGGTITGGTAKQGGNVYLNNGATFTMYGGTITKGKANQGGNIWLGGANTSLVVYGGTIEGGLEDNASNAANGGNIFVYEGAVEIMDGTISGGNASTSGGNVYMTDAGCSFVMYGGELTGGKAGSHGGQMFSNSTSALIEIVDVTVSGGEATTGRGGNFYFSGASTQIYLVDCVVENGTAATWGGNICNSGSQTTLILANTTVNGGTAGEFGDSIYCTGILGIEDSTVTGDIYVMNTAKVALAGNVAIGTTEGGALDLTLAPSLTLADLTAEAEIYVTANADQVITEGEGVEAYAANFKCAEGFTVTGAEGKLTYGAVAPTA